MKKLFGISSSARRGYDAVLVAKNQVVENESAHKKVEGDLDNEHVSCGGELGNQSLSMSQKGANQLEHFANVLRGRAVDVVHESTGVAWGYGMNRERSYTKTGADVCPRGFYESCVPDSTKKACVNTDAHVPNMACRVTATSNIPVSMGDADKQVLSDPGLINHGDLEALRAEFTEAIVQEMLHMPTTTGRKIPNYFNNDGEIDVKLLPSHLHGLKVKLTDLAVTAEEFNLLIYEAFILPEGREELFCENEPGCVHGFEATIELMDPSPWYARLRPMAQEDKVLFEEVLNRYLAQKLIEKAMGATSCAIAMLVKKPSGRNQLAFDYRELNKRVVACLWPLPLLGDCLDCMGLAVFLSSLDVNGAYHSVPVAEASRNHLAFLCPYGIYRWTRLPYGYKNSGPIFCQQIAEAMMGLVYTIVSLYADDSKIFGGSTVRMHIKCISLCLNRLHKKGFRLSLKKCLFFVKSMEHLGFTAVVGGTKPTQHNIRKLLAIAIKKVKDIRGFIGLSNYYRRFVRGYSEIVAPLLPYLRKDARLPAVLPADITIAIDEIKRILATFPILRNPDFKRQFVLETDGSKHGFGAALKQVYEGVEMVCAYASSHILKCQLKYSSDMLELVAAVWGMKHFHHYLRKPFILKTDNIIMKWLRKKTVDATKPSFIRWILEAQEYDFEVQHVPGKQLVAGDLMSRAGARDSDVDPILVKLESSKYFKAALKIQRALDREVKQDLAPVTLDRDVWIREQATDPRLIRVAANKLNQERCFELVDGLWYHKQVYHRKGSMAVAKLRIVVPVSLRPTLMAIVHGLLGHRGVKPIVRYLTRLLYWPGIWIYVRAWVGSCSDCKRRKMSRVKQPWLGDVKHMTTPWYFVAIDYILGELPVSADGYRYCLTVMCVFTRYPFAIPLRTKDPDELATALFTFVFSVFGLPVIVHSDHDSTLINQALELVFKRFNVKRSYTLWSHPESNGHLERFHRLVNETMAIILPRYTDWPEMLPVVMFTYRNLVNETTGYTPHFMNFGRNALMPLEITWCVGVLNDVMSPSELAAASRSYVDRLISRLQGAFHFVRRAQWLASKRNKDRLAPKTPEVAGKRKRNIEAIHFKTGDMVYLREEASVHNKVGKMRDLIPSPDEFVPVKWRFKWTGPHLVKERDGERAYVIYHSERHEELIVHVDDLRIHDAFSDELFDTAQGTAYVVPRDLPPPLGYNIEFPKDAKSLQPAVGDMCLAHVPLFKPEDFVIVKALGDGEFQWFSSTFAGGRLDNNWDSFEVLERTTWLPGWLLEPEFQRVQYVYHQPMGSRPWTCTMEELPFGFMLWGFDLTASSKVRKAMMSWVRQYVRPPNSTVVRHGL